MLNRMTSVLATFAVAHASDTLSMSVREVAAPYDKYASLRSDKPITKKAKELSFYDQLFGESGPTEF